jgi:hypothetical protein
MSNDTLNLIKRAYVSAPTNDENDYCSIQVSYYDRTAYAQPIYPYGLCANAPTNTSVLLFNVLGQEENLAGIPYTIAERFRSLKTGEVAIGSPKTGSYIKFEEDGSIKIVAKKGITISTEDGDIIFNSSQGIAWNATTDAIMTSLGNFTVTTTTYTVNGQVNLGSGGAKIARLGDQVTIGSNTGTITGSGNNTSI